MTKIFGIQILLDIYPQLPFTHRAIEHYIETDVEEKNINIVFVTGSEIKELNTEFRDKSEVTDVLSFNIDTKDLLGEIYICPEYVINNFQGEKYVEEILRLIVHGVLHLQGMDHDGKFDNIEHTNEPMYIKQEEILNKMLKNILQK